MIKNDADFPHRFFVISIKIALLSDVRRLKSGVFHRTGREARHPLRIILFY